MIQYKGRTIWHSCSKRGSIQRSYYIMHNGRRVRFLYTFLNHADELHAIDRAKYYIDKNMNNEKS